jgi:hypothetical protein
METRGEGERNIEEQSLLDVFKSSDWVIVSKGGEATR